MPRFCGRATQISFQDSPFSDDGGGLIALCGFERHDLRIRGSIATCHARDTGANMAGSQQEHVKIDGSRRRTLAA
jgi:hypothetical protein